MKKLINKSYVMEACKLATVMPVGLIIAIIFKSIFQKENGIIQSRVLLSVMILLTSMCVVFLCVYILLIMFNKKNYIVTIIIQGILFWGMTMSISMYLGDYLFIENIDIGNLISKLLIFNTCGIFFGKFTTKKEN